MPACVRNNVDLTSLNTLAVSARATYFMEVFTVEDILKARQWAQSQGVGISILGGGSNVLLNSVENALVLSVKIPGIEVVEESASELILEVGAGVIWHDFVRWAVDRDLSGIENLALIPGRVGAAPIQNIGAYGVDVSSTITEVATIDLNTGQSKTLTNSQCAFSYRESVFKKAEGKHLLVHKVRFRLSRDFKPQLDYPALRASFTETKPASAKQVANAVARIRNEKLPPPSEIPNAGSFFKNPIVPLSRYQALIDAFPTLVSFNADDEHKKLAAAWLIDQCGWKGKLVRDVRVHDKQALVIVNPNKKAIADVMELVRQIRKSVQEKFGVLLEVEPQFLHHIAIK